MKISEFKFLSLLERQEMEPDNFGDPDRRLFPILSQEDVDKAPKRIRRAHGVADLKDRIITIAIRKGFKLPDEWAEIAASAATIDKQTVTVYSYAS